MADAYDIMSMAKRWAARAQLQDDVETYEKDLAAYQKKKQKGSFWGGLASIGLGLLMPQLLPGLKGGAGLAKLLGQGATRGMINLAGTELVKNIAGGKAKIPGFKATSTGPYGGAGRRAMSKEAAKVTRDIQSELDAGMRNQLFMSALSGFMPDKDAWGDLFKGKGALQKGQNIISGHATWDLPGEGIIGSKPSSGMNLDTLKILQNLSREQSPGISQSNLNLFQLQKLLGLI